MKQQETSVKITKNPQIENALGLKEKLTKAKERKPKRSNKKKGGGELNSVQGVVHCRVQS